MKRIVILSVFGVFLGCGSPLHQLAGKNLKKQESDSEAHKLGTLGKTIISQKNLAFYNMDGRVYGFDEIQNMPQSLKDEIFRRELLRREVIRRGFEEGLFKDAEAEAYIWPRMEKILEEYYYYKKLNYQGILSSNKVRFSGNKAIEKFYEKNKETFAKDRLSVDDIKVQIARKIQLLTEKEFEEKKIASIQELLKKEKIQILK